MSLRTIKLMFATVLAIYLADRPGLVLCDSCRHHRHSQRPRYPQVQLQNGSQPPLLHPPGPDHRRPDLRSLRLWHLDLRHLPGTLRPSGLPIQLEAGIAPRPSSSPTSC